MDAMSSLQFILQFRPGRFGLCLLLVSKDRIDLGLRFLLFNDHVGGYFALFGGESFDPGLIEFAIGAETADLVVVLTHLLYQRLNGGSTGSHYLLYFGLLLVGQVKAAKRNADPVAMAAARAETVPGLVRSLSDNKDRCGNQQGCRNYSKNYFFHDELLMKHSKYRRP